MCTLIDVANATVASDFSRQQNVGGCIPAPTNFCVGWVFGAPWPLLRAAYVDILPIVGYFTDEILSLALKYKLIK